MQGCPLELLPMEFSELDEARRVADLAAKASWRAKEKSRARKKAKLDNNGGVMVSGSVGSLDGRENMTMDLSASNLQPTPPPPPQTTTLADLRTGRWTSEETTYCDKLIQKFMAGRLPLPEGIKLNEFLSNMLKSKQSRLTKKMKNAKLSSKTFKRISGYLSDVMEAREFSENEDGFFHSLQNGLERAEIKFHMQKEWRETFSTYCVSHGQPLNVDRWLASVEEMERRAHRAKDVERMQRRKMMMGQALRQDLQNPDRGVVIENSKKVENAVSAQQQMMGSSQAGAYPNNGSGGQFAVPDPMISASASMMGNMSSSSMVSLGDAGIGGGGESQSQCTPSPFLHKIMAYVQRHHVPFEYIDAWVPSFVPDADGNDPQQPPSENGSVAGMDNKENGEPQPKCRLCFAGSMVAKQVISGDTTAASGQTQTRGRAIPLSSDDQFNLSAFGDYSESFSFDVGCGLPGRVYHMGVPTWEQSVHNAPLHHFERVGGSQQWGIKTVVGIPVPSPNVGRIVVVLYSRHDRAKDHDMVIRLTEEFARLMPSPKWKLVVDVGQQAQHAQVVPPPPTQAAVSVVQQQPMQQQGQPQQQQQAQPLQQQQNQSMDMQQNQNNNGAAAQPPSNPAALTSEVISIFGEHMPSDPSNPAFAYLQGFMSLRLLLLRASRTEQEQDLVNTILSSYSSYKAGGRTRPDIALMLARDFMFLNQHQQPQQQVQVPQHVQMQQQQVPPQHQQHQVQAMQQLQQPNNGQQQFAQQSFAPAPSHMQPQQQQNYSSPAISSMGNPGNMTMPPPPSSPHGSATGIATLENNSYNNPNNMVLQHQNQMQDQQQQGQQQQHSMPIQQYQQHQQPPPQQQQQQYSQVDNNTNLLMGDLVPMPQDPMMGTTMTAAGGDNGVEESPTISAEG